MMLKSLLATAFVLVLADLLYLFAMKECFRKQVVLVQGKTLHVNVFSAILAYILMVVLLYKFIIAPRESLQKAFLLGICVIGVYEYTNLAIFQDWKWSTAIMDTLWGGLLFGGTTWLVRKI